MNDKSSNEMDRENEAIAQKLNQVAEQTHVNSQFAAKLEERLRSAHQRPSGLFAAWFTDFAHIALGGFDGPVGIGVKLEHQELVPAPQPAINNTSGKFVCPVTIPNGSQPYGKIGEEDPNFHGNGQLWTKLWPNGKVYMLPSDQATNGSFSQKWYFERGVTGTLTVDGHRLDAEAAPLRADIPDGYGVTGLQVLNLIFPTTGCWEVTGHVGNVSLTFVTEVVFGEATPTPSVAIIANTATPNATEVIATGYDFRGAKLYLGGPLPETPNKAHIYLLKKDEPATQEQARALADRFGIQSGEVYNAPDYIFSTTGYAFSDGKQLLQVYSDRFFTYTADIAKSRTNPYGFKPSDRAEATIQEFLKARGFDFSFKLSETYFPGEYTVKPLGSQFDPHAI